jgi:integrative and conjugative element protein (TIGR02256 family)
MQFIDSWATTDQRILLSLADPVLAVFERYIQLSHSDCEAGGLLLGTVHGAHIAVVEATIPTICDKRLRHLFERMPFGHSSIARKRWHASGGTVRYVGEWHTHPQDFPQPSGLDRTEWNKLSCARTDGRPTLAVIVGRKGLYVELVPHIGIGPMLTPLD